MSSAQLQMDNGRKHYSGYIPLSIASWQPFTLSLLYHNSVADWGALLPPGINLPSTWVYTQSAQAIYCMFSYLLPYSQIPNPPLYLTILTPHQIWIRNYIHSSVILFIRQYHSYSTSYVNQLYFYLYPTHPIQPWFSCRLRSTLPPGINLPSTWVILNLLKLTNLSKFHPYP